MAAQEFAKQIRNKSKAKLSNDGMVADQQDTDGVILQSISEKFAETVDHLNDLAKDISLKKIALSTDFQQIFSNDDQSQRRTKIIGTIGPACGSVD